MPFLFSKLRNWDGKEGEEGSYIIGSTYASSISYFPGSGDMKHSLLYKEKSTYECFTLSVLTLMSSNPYHKNLHALIGKDNLRGIDMGAERNKIDAKLEITRITKGRHQ